MVFRFPIRVDASSTPRIGSQQFSRCFVLFTLRISYYIDRFPLIARILIRLARSCQSLCASLLRVCCSAEGTKRPRNQPRHPRGKNDSLYWRWCPLRRKTFGTAVLHQKKINPEMHSRVRAYPSRNPSKAFPSPVSAWRDAGVQMQRSLLTLQEARGFMLATWTD